jgi:DNA-binding transcriptional MerR regulator
MPSDLDASSPYTIRRVQELVGVTRATLSRLIDAGIVSPSRGPRNEYRFTYQDLVLIRTAQGLHDAHIAPRRIAESLRKVRARLPAEMPLTGIRVSVIGRDVVVRDALSPWAADTGQRVMEFQVEPAGTEVVFLPARPAAPATPATTGPSEVLESGDAAQWFARGESLEVEDVRGAEAAYRQALRADPACVDASLNLGALLCEQGRCGEAAALYDTALALSPGEPLLFFNRAIAREDLHRDAEAAQDYERCLALSPDERDAHWNVAQVYERLGDARRAVRHLNAYRRSEGR